MVTRRNFLRLLGIGSVSAISCGAYARYIESDWFDVTTVRLDRSRFQIKEGLRILHLSDLHSSPEVPYSMLEHAIDLGLNLKPDLVCLTGDFITSKLENADEYSRILRRFSDAVPTYACQGNHDIPIIPIRRMLKNANVIFLENRSEEIEIKGCMLRISGVSDFWNGAFEPDRCLLPKPDAAFSQSESIQNELPHLLLCHNPDGKTRLKNYEWDVMLCGHTHGGQVCLPFYGPLHVPVRDKQFLSGLYEWDGRQVYITRGVGNLYGIRFYCRPEITLLTV